MRGSARTTARRARSRVYFEEQWEAKTSSRCHDDVSRRPAHVSRLSASACVHSRTLEDFASCSRAFHRGMSRTRVLALSRFGRRPWMLLVVVPVVAGLGWLARDLWHPSIAGDGVGLYAPLTSLFLDRDLDFSNEFAHSDGSIRRRWLTDRTDAFVSPYPVGAAILWFPPVAAAWLFDPRKSSYGQPDRWQNTSPGFQERYILAIAIGTVLETLVGGSLL